MQVGDQIGHYTVIEHIGRGGMADVWSARDERLHRTVAVKTIAADLSEARAQEQFQHEARTIAALEHSNILPIYDFGEFQRQLYIVMRYVSGGSLMDRLIEGPLSDAEVVRVGEAIASALERAHAENIVHRDLKPANVLLDRFGVPYLADFGLAVVAGGEGEEGMSSGTLLYMPPEQVLGEPVDHRADIYAFAIMLFQMLTGEFPFEGKAALCLRQVQEGDELPDPRLYRSDLPGGVVNVLRIATSIDLQARFGSAGLLMTEVLSAMQGPSSMSAAAPARVARLADESRGPGEEAVPYQADTELSMEDMVPTITGIDSAELISGQFQDTIDLDSSLVSAVAPDEARPDDTIDLVPLVSQGAIPLITESEEFVAESSGVREARDVFSRMVRAWARGQGRFLTGATHFANLHAYYSEPDEHNLTLDDVGREVMLRGAVEHNYELDFWLAQVPDVGTRRHVLLHALRSDSAQARALAAQLLVDVPDGDGVNIAVSVGRLLHSETSQDARHAIVALLATRARPSATWHSYVYTLDTDLLLAEQALASDAPEVAEMAARAIGRLKSESALLHLVEQGAGDPAAVRRALAWVRDECDTLPNSVPLRWRARAFARLTGYYLTTDLARFGLRFFTSLVGAGVAMGLFIHIAFGLPSLLILLHLYRVIGNGQTFGLVAGFGITLAVALPVRLAGSVARRENGATLWRGWARFLMGLLLGGAVGTIAYLNYQVIALSWSDPKLEAVAIGGFGLALGAALASTFRWPLGVRIGLTMLTFFGGLWIGWELSKRGITDASIPLRSDADLWLVIVMSLLAALGAYGPEIIGWLRGLVRGQR
ncbi:MAG: protein kinase [Anaerolineae bacterium]|nr:protein kinase [Anaerolineae bacterium]